MCVNSPLAYFAIFANSCEIYIINLFLLTFNIILTNAESILKGCYINAQLHHMRTAIESELQTSQEDIVLVFMHSSFGWCSRSYDYFCLICVIFCFDCSSAPRNASTTTKPHRAIQSIS